ncbi:MAG: tetratricopeptide repeat protein [Chloroflexota bacterium]
MYYRPQPKKRSPFLTFLLSITLIGMLGVLTILVGMYIGYVPYEPPPIAEQFGPTATPTRDPLLDIADGDTLASEGKLQEAIEAYNLAIQKDPENDIPYVRQSHLLIYTHDSATAVQQAEQAVLLNPDSPENLSAYCRALDWEARYSEAFAACSCAIELDPTYAEAYAFLSEVYADQGNWVPAETNAQEAIDRNFQSAHAHHNMGYALEVQGRYAEAVEFYENAITLSPNLSPLYIDAGRSYYWLNDFEQAATLFKQAIRLSPYDPEAYNWLGWTYYTNGDYNLAVDALEQSAGIAPNYTNINRGVNVWGHLGVLQYTLQNFEEATQVLPRAIELAENNFVRRARQVEIYTEVSTLTGVETIPVLRGQFTIPDTDSSLSYIATLEPVNYVQNQLLDPEQSCTAALVRDIKNEAPLLSSPEGLTFTQSFSQTRGTATLDTSSGILSLDLTDLALFETSRYEIRVTFWPNRTDTVGNFELGTSTNAKVNIQFEEKLAAPIEYYYELGLAYAYQDPPRCEQAVPWLLKALDLDSSFTNPAWAGLQICPSQNSPPTPLPTFTPVPDIEN